MRRAAAWLALFAFAAGLILPASVAVHAPDDADAAWGAARLLASHAQTQVEPVRPPTDDDHCAICHWLRALNHSVRTANLRGPHLAAGVLAAAAIVTAPQTGTDASAPARAPPASL